jgi:hypothetical protein
MVTSTNQDTQCTERRKELDNGKGSDQWVWENREGCL